VKSREQYSVEDFMTDESFIRWVYSPDQETSDSWNEFLLLHPEKTGEINEAKHLLLSIRIAPPEIAPDALSRLHARINERIDNPTLSVSKLNARRSNQKLYWYAAAVIALLLCSFIIYISQRTTPTAPSSSKIAQRVEGGVEEQVMPKGKRSTITLPDGTRVWLNADTKLTYAKDFHTGATRDVYLTGEAFFKVVSNKTRPFIVHTSDVDIRVLGTSFNVKAYQKEEEIETTLVEGKIAIEEEAGRENTTILPNQRAVFVKEQKKLIVENNVETENYTAWKSGVLVFDDKPFYEIIPVLERWFNVTIHTGSNSNLDCRFTAKINNKSLEEVLELFESSDRIEYKIKGNEVFFEGSLCED
jgi:transmembrane sensor